MTEQCFLDFYSSSFHYYFYDYHDNHQDNNGVVYKTVHTCIHIFLFMYLYIYIYMCVCECLCMSIILNNHIIINDCLKKKNKHQRQTQELDTYGIQLLVYFHIYLHSCCSSCQSLHCVCVHVYVCFFFFFLFNFVYLYFFTFYVQY